MSNSYDKETFDRMEFNKIYSILNDTNNTPTTITDTSTSYNIDEFKSDANEFFMQEFVNKCDKYPKYADDYVEALITQNDDLKRENDVIREKFTTLVEENIELKRKLFKLVGEINQIKFDVESIKKEI